MITPSPVILKSKIFEKEFENKIYILKIDLQEKILNFDLTIKSKFPKKIYSNKLSKENLQNLSILFMDKKSEMSDCFQVISDLIDNDKLNIKKNENVINLNFSPKIYMIKDFEIELKEIKLNQSQINDLLSQQIKYLEKEIRTLKNNVLFISKDKKQSILYKLLKQSPCVNKISVFDPNTILSDLSKKILSQFKIIVYDIFNGGFFKTENKNKEEIKNYVSKGGNIIVTHDHWTYSKINPEIGGYSELIGARLKEQSYSTTNKAKVLKKNHSIFKSFFDLTSESNNEIINICSTHKTDTIYDNIDEYNKDLIIQLEDGKQGEYLLIKEIGKGKIIFWNVEHSSITEFEKKLFINSLSWIYECLSKDL